MKSPPYEFVCRVYAASLYAYPRAFRAQFGREMQQVFRDRCRAAAQTHAFPQFLFMTIKDWFTTSLRERLAVRQESAARPLWSAVLHHPAFIWMFAIFASLFVSSTVVRAYVIPTASMEGNLRIGDHLLVDRLHSHALDVHRGDMITFLYPEDASQTYIKRVIGLPGDRIRLSGKQVITATSPGTAATGVSCRARVWSGNPGSYSGPTMPRPKIWPRGTGLTLPISPSTSSPRHAGRGRCWCSAISRRRKWRPDGEHPAVECTHA
jgi:signal peptidase I